MFFIGGLSILERSFRKGKVSGTIVPNKFLRSINSNRFMEDLGLLFKLKSFITQKQGRGWHIITGFGKI